MIPAVSPKGFIYLPVELRIKIYEFVLTPRPHTHLLCRAPGQRHLASTCIVAPSTLRTIPARTTPILRASPTAGAGAAAILATCRQVLHEAAATLYGNAQILLMQAVAQDVAFRRTLELPHYALTAIKTFFLVVEIGAPCSLWIAYASAPQALTTYLPSLKVFRIHLDVDLTGRAVFFDTCSFDHLYSIADSVDFEVDVHIIRAYKEEEPGWVEVISSREGNEEVACILDGVAKQMRTDFIEAMRKSFERQQKKLRVREIVTEQDL